jgi:ferritin
MIISKKSFTAMNEQIQNEFYASAQYIAIGVYFDEVALPELSQFFFKQAEEERAHAMKFVRFLLQTGTQPIIPGLPAVRNEFSSAADAVQFALDQELKVTDQINNLVKIAIAENDFTSNSFLQWFVIEQIEEVDTMTILLHTIEHAADNLLLVEDFVRRSAMREAANEA